MARTKARRNKDRYRDPKYFMGKCSCCRSRQRLYTHPTYPHLCTVCLKALVPEEYAMINAALKEGEIVDVRSDPEFHAALQRMPEDVRKKLLAEVDKRERELVQNLNKPAPLTPEETQLKIAEAFK